MAGWTSKRSPSGSCGNKLFFPGWEHHRRYFEVRLREIGKQLAVQ